ncbi:reverse transcriptase domain-containing protein, partial [Cupriavidus sp. 8B]
MDKAKPCGVPLSGCTTVPSGICTGALSQRSIYSSTHAQSAWRRTARIINSQSILPKKFLMSRSGGVVSPVLANLFLHYAFDRWMRKHHPDVPFERYADDVICHCKSEAQARRLKQGLEMRLAECKLDLHPEKTKIVYCKQANRHASYPICQFDFLGYTFRPRSVRNRVGKLSVGFLPAVSN